MAFTLMEWQLSCKIYLLLTAIVLLQLLQRCNLLPYFILENVIYLFYIIIHTSFLGICKMPQLLLHGNGYRVQLFSWAY